MPKNAMFIVLGINILRVLSFLNWNNSQNCSQRMCQKVDDDDDDDGKVQNPLS